MLKTGTVYSMTEDRNLDILFRKLGLYIHSDGGILIGRADNAYWPAHTQIIESIHIHYIGSKLVFKLHSSDLYIAATIIETLQFEDRMDNPRKLHLSYSSTVFYDIYSCVESLSKHEGMVSLAISNTDTDSIAECFNSDLWFTYKKGVSIQSAVDQALYRHKLIIKQ